MQPLRRIRWILFLLNSCALHPLCLHAATLEEALDTQKVVWTTFGDAPWFSQTNTTWDGIDAAQSGAIQRTQVSTLRVTETGAIAFAFRVRLSGGVGGADYLRLYHNGFEAAVLGGAITWTDYSFPLYGGADVIEWRYLKDSTVPAGTDRAFLDDVLFVFSNTPPHIRAHPISQTNTATSSASFSVRAMGAGPLSYQWRLNGTNLLGATNVTLALTNMRTTDAGSYSVLVSNAFGVAISSNAFLAVTASLSDALDTPGVVWTTYGDAPWLGTTNVTHDGVDAIECRPFAASQFSVIQTAITGPGTFTFWWRFRPPGSGAVFSFQVDNVERAKLQLVTEWTPVTFQVTQGYHSVKFILYSGNSGSDPSGGAWLDEALFLNGAPMFTSPPSNTVVDVGVAVSFGAGAAGTPPMNYQWRFNGTNLALETNASLTISNAQPLQAGLYSVAVTNQFGGAVSSNAYLTVIGHAPTIVEQPATQSSAIHRSLVLFTSAIGSPPLTFQWFFEGFPLADQTNRFLLISNFNENIAGQYELKVTNAFGNAMSVIALLNLNTNALTRIVTQTNDSGVGSLRQAVADAQDGDVILLPAGFTLVLTQRLVIDKNLLVQGTDAVASSIRGAVGVEMIGVANRTLEIRDVSLLGAGRSAIANDGAVLAQRVQFLGNYGVFGGALYNATNRAAWLQEVAVVTNNAAYGAGIYNDGVLTVVLGTFSANRCTYLGGAIYNTLGARCDLRHCTVASNEVYISVSCGGGLFNRGQMDLANCLVANNRSTNTGCGPDVGGRITLRGFNLIRTTNDATIQNISSNDVFGVTPMLGPLGDYGGNTLTHPLLMGSPGIGQGHSFALNQDQRREFRPMGVSLTADSDGTDIGAYEVSSPTLRIKNAVAVELSSGVNTGRVDVVLTPPSQQMVWVEFLTGDGTATAPFDYLARAGVLAFAPGTTNSSIEITISDDLLVEPSEFLNVHLLNATNASIGVSDGRLTVIEQDRDGDGMADDFESSFGFDVNNPDDGQADADDDGMSNADEYRAGTNPSSAASTLRIASAWDEAGFRLRISTAIGKSYRIERRNNFSSTWIVVASGIAGTGAMSEFTDAAPLGMTRFYRVAVEP
jgi:hypothetical protein